MARRSIEAVAIKQDFAALIAERAYFKAEQRGFAPGHELEDWLAAEREITGFDAQPTPIDKPKKTPIDKPKKTPIDKPKKTPTRRKNGTAKK